MQRYFLKEYFSASDRSLKNIVFEKIGYDGYLELVRESLEIIKEIKSKVPNVPVFLGGGANGDNIAELMTSYDGVSVATWIKDGNMSNDINPVRAKIFMDQVKKSRIKGE